MANTMTLIQSVTVGAGGASSIDFTSIPSTYTDLVVKISGRANLPTTDQTFNIRFNGSSASSYSTRRLYGSGSSAASDSDTSTTSINIYSVPSANATSSTFGNAEIYIPNYSGNANKSVSVDSVSEDNATRALATLAAGLWSNTAAINQVTVLINGSNFVQYSTAYLYGVKNA